MKVYMIRELRLQPFQFLRCGQGNIKCPDDLFFEPGAMPRRVRNLREGVHRLINLLYRLYIRWKIYAEVGVERIEKYKLFQVEIPDDPSNSIEDHFIIPPGHAIVKRAFG